MGAIYPPMANIVMMYDALGKDESYPPRAATRRGIDRIATVVRETGAERVVVGLPLSLSGGDSPQTAEARAFAARLAERLAPSVPVELYDERFTTRIAQRSGSSRASEDSRAAAVLLEDWLAAHGPTDHLA
jgi:putative Holliday junction resolvase